MSELLLSSEKRSRFETMIERAIREEFDERTDVLIESDGRLIIRAEGSDSKAAEATKRQSELYLVLSELDFEFGQSSYRLASTGYGLYLERDGW